jgi:hypothetical protein
MQQAVGEPILDAKVCWFVEDRNDPAGWQPQERQINLLLK